MADKPCSRESAVDICRPAQFSANDPVQSDRPARPRWAHGRPAPTRSGDPSAKPPSRRSHHCRAHLGAPTCAASRPRSRSCRQSTRSPSTASGASPWLRRPCAPLAPEPRGRTGILTTGRPARVRWASSIRSLFARLSCPRCSKRFQAHQSEVGTCRHVQLPGAGLTWNWWRSEFTCTGPSCRETEDHDDDEHRTSGAAEQPSACGCHAPEVIDPTGRRLRLRRSALRDAGAR
jgi:hypothetical protein